MASKQEFLKELKDQDTILGSWLSEASEEIAADASQVANLKEERREAIDAIVNRLLPDLTDQTILSLKSFLPDFLTPAEVTAAIEKEKEDIQKRLETLLAWFKRDTARVRTLQIEAAFRKEKESYDIVKDGLKPFEYLLTFTYLVESGYGTPQYTGKWWQPRYYRDWKNADLCAESLDKKDWAEALATYNDLRSSLETSERSIRKMEEEVQFIAQNERRAAALGEELAEVNGTVLEKIRVQLKAHLDSLSPAPEWMARVTSIDKKIEEFQNHTNTVLQPRRESVMKQQTELRKIIATASQSRAREIPDAYLATAREKNATMRDRSIPAQSTHWREEPSALETLMWYDLLTNHFGSATHSMPSYDAPFASTHSHERVPDLETTYGRVS